jgi:hypothetical protein
VNNVAVCVNPAGARDATTSEVADTTGEAARIALDSVTRLNGLSLGNAWTRRRADIAARGTTVTGAYPVVRGAHTRRTEATMGSRRCAANDANPRFGCRWTYPFAESGGVNGSNLLPAPPLGARPFR